MLKLKPKPARVGVRGRVRTILREDGIVLFEAVDDNIETQYALNAIASWLVGGAGVVAPAPPSYLSFGLGAINALTAMQADFETGITGWQAASNCTLAQSSAQAWNGAFSLALTASSAATMTATTLPGTSGQPVTVGYQYSATIHARAATAGRQVGVNIAWYDASGTLLSTSAGTTSANSTSAWTRTGVVATAPTNAAFAAVQVTVTSPGNGEVHYIDGCQFAYAPDGPMAWQEGGITLTPSVNDVRLQQERYLTRTQVDTGYTQQGLAVVLHTYQQTDPSGSFAEAGLWDSGVNSSGYLNANASAGDQALTLAGSTPAVAAGTQIYIPAAPLAAPAAPTFSAASTTGGFLVGGTTYYYKVTATDTYGETVPGAEASYAVPAGTSTNQITLTWSAVVGATGYKVYRSTSSGNEQLLATTVSATYVDNTNTVPSGAPPTSDTSGSHAEYATIAAAAAAGATAWTLTDQLIYPHPARITSGTTIINAPVVAFVGNLWAHVTLTGVAKTGTQLLTLQWEIEVSNAP